MSNLKLGIKITARSCCIGLLCEQELWLPTFASAMNVSAMCLLKQGMHSDQKVKYVKNWLTLLLRDIRSCLQGAAQAPVTSMYVQQLLSTTTNTPESAVQKELLDLKAQITDAAAVLEHEKQAFQLSRVRQPCKGACT